VAGDEKDSCILHSEVVKTVKEMRDQKARGDGDVPEDVLKLFGEYDLKIMTNLSTTYMKLECAKGLH
jgi:hypothetical protein